MQLFSADATIFFFFNFADKNLKNHPQKMLKNNDSLTAARTAQTEEFMFRNVAYRPTVYKTGLLPTSYSIPFLLNAVLLTY